jgi:hypothetical protein
MKKYDRHWQDVKLCWMEFCLIGENFYRIYRGRLEDTAYTLKDMLSEPDRYQETTFKASGE